MILNSKHQIKGNFEKKKTLSFDKGYYEHIFFYDPEKYKEIEVISNKYNNIITSGSQLSYPALSFEKKSLSIGLQKFNRIINFNKKKKEITVEAGMRIFELLNFTMKHNLWISQLPGHPYITLGGAIAANVHGKSCGYHGTIRNSVKSILLYHKTNGWLVLSNNKNSDIFQLTLGGLGLTGTIVSITFDLEELKFNEFIEKKQKIKSLKNLIKNISSLKPSNNEFIYSWNTASNVENFGKGYIFRNIGIKSNKFIKKINCNDRNFKKYTLKFWNKFSINLFNYFYYIYQDFGNNKKIDFVNTIFPFFNNETYFSFFGKSGFIESQLILPKNNLQNFLDEFLFLHKKLNPSITLFSLKIFKGKQKFLRFEKNGVCVTFDFIRNNKNIFFLSKLDKLYAKYKILPSVIKDSRIQNNVIEKCYPEINKFRKKLKEFDRDRFYQSELSKRLKI